MKNIFAILIICLLINCKENPKKERTKKESFSLKGTINGDYSDYIYLNYRNAKDSTEVLNNSFEFKGKVDKPIQGSLNLKPYANIVPLYIENSKITIQANYEELIRNEKKYNILKINNIEGSYSAKIQEEYKEFYQANQNKENFRALLFEKLTSFIELNKNHPISGTILGENALIEPVLTKRELIELYSKIDTTQQSKDDLEMFKMGIANLEKYGINKPFLKFILPNNKDKDIDITTFLGKITLVDFWASWCGPCRIKHPELVKLKKKFENVNFDIVSVSIDDNRKSWIKAIEKDNLTWTNLIDIDKQVNNELGIEAIPFNYLIDENGIVIGVNLSLEQIENELKKVSK
ncbi:TlpA disulfide reductase family protein [uncultured Psychroserpens sp.]|uniref:TlpA disulfide reductase family protein n=1 Tax=uncultured Psychroserpens sp. TaxID=255436 RepID=UPI00262E33C0|nr:TlpA disulfide reductase family protein [uncultured Psychroserpens sp.]